MSRATASTNTEIMQYKLSLHNYPTVFCPPADSLWRQLEREREKTLFAGSLCFRERARRGKKMLCVGCITTFFVSDWELPLGIHRWGDERKKIDFFKITVSNIFMTISVQPPHTLYRSLFPLYSFYPPPSRKYFLK